MALLARIILHRKLKENPYPAHFRLMILKLTIPLWIFGMSAGAVSNLMAGKPLTKHHLVMGVSLVLMSWVFVQIWRKLRPELAAEKRRMQSEKRLPQNMKPTFLWQGALILLPILLLSVFGVVAIVRDRSVVEKEAEQRAQEILSQVSENFGRIAAMKFSDYDRFAYQWDQELYSRLGRWPESEERRRWEIVSDFPKLFAEWKTNFPGLDATQVFPNDFSFQLNGELDRPKDYDPFPQPPDWFRQLDREQRAAWDELEKLPLITENIEQIKKLADTFLATNPSGFARTNAQFLKLRAEWFDTPATNAVKKLLQLTWSRRDVPTASGLPLANFIFAEAIRRARETGPDERLWREIDSQVKSSPSFLTPLLLNEMESLANTVELKQSIAAWRVIWAGDERQREMARLVQQTGKVQGITTDNLWLDYAGQRWFFMLEPAEFVTHTSSAGKAIKITNEVTRVVFYPQSAMEAAFRRALKEKLKKISMPDYFGFSVQLEGLALKLFPTESTNSFPTLAEVPDKMTQPSGMHSNDGIGKLFEGMPSRPRFILRIHLTDRDLLFSQQRQRSWLYGSLIGLAAIAALIGFVTAQRAFHRQLGLSEMKSNFVSSVSHELRAPIASVRLMAEGLERGKISTPEKQQEYFRFIGQECRRLSSLIENVLDFSRIEQGRKQYEFEPTDIVKLVSETVKVMEPYALEKNVKLSLRWNDHQWVAPASRGCENMTVDKSSHPRDAGATHSNRFEPGAMSDCVLLDGRAMQQALVNLIDNAIKHSANGATVTIGLEQRSAGFQPALDSDTGKAGWKPALRVISDSTLLWVEDSGPGIPPQEQEKIFERFYRLGSELRRETQGIGIGLSIVQHIVTAHGGRVLVQSEVGKGSRFTIEIPVNHHKTTA